MPSSPAQGLMNSFDISSAKLGLVSQRDTWKWRPEVRDGQDIRCVFIVETNLMVKASKTKARHAKHISMQ